MDEAIMENLLNLANRVLILGGDLDSLRIIAVALLLVFLVARIVKRKHGGLLKFLRAWGTVTNKRGRLQRSPALKPCPNCAEQLPLATIICNICDYNFLAERPGRGQRSLPPPKPMTHEGPEQIAFRPC